VLILDVNERANYFQVDAAIGGLNVLTGFVATKLGIRESGHVPPPSELGQRFGFPEEPRLGRGQLPPWASESPPDKK
jgi:hypothetical protein